MQKTRTVARPLAPLLKSHTTRAASIPTLAHLSTMKVTLRRSGDRGHADHGWLNSYHTFSFASYYDPRFESFGAIRVLNEDRVAPGTGFPTHSHRDAEIFSYILSGELTHRDSMASSKPSPGKDDFYRMKRGDVQFTTGGTGIAHSEQNEHSTDEVHFLQIWALPWRKGLKPQYHTMTFDESRKCDAFLPIISPLKADDGSTPTIPGTISIHADLHMAASIISPGAKATWTVGNANAAINSTKGRRVYVHLPMRRIGAAVELEGTDNKLAEGDGAFIQDVDAGDRLTFKSVGSGEAEVIVLDSN